jgi:hypothetical protein
MSTVFVKRFDNLGMFEQGRWAEMIEWCQKQVVMNKVEPTFYPGWNHLSRVGILFIVVATQTTGSKLLHGCAKMSQWLHKMPVHNY